MLITVATRKSPLARKQTELAVEWIVERLPRCEVTTLPLSTQVDERLSWSLEKRGSLGLFTKELEEALLEGTAEIAIHSAKDLPTTLPEGLSIAGYLPRGNPHDTMILRHDVNGEPRTIASASPRRRHQLMQRFPDASWTSIRGNVETRLNKIQAGAADASILASVGLERLSIASHQGLKFETLSIESMVPAPGQAAIAIECKTSDLPYYQGLFCEKTFEAVELERAFLRRIGGGCQTPVGAYYDQSALHIYHPTCGYQKRALDLPDHKNLDPFIDTLINELNLKNRDV